MSKRSTVGRFIENERKKGISDTQIKHALLDAGWHMDIIEHSLKDHPATIVKANKPLTMSKNMWFRKLLNPFLIGSIFIGLMLFVAFI